MKQKVVLYFAIFVAFCLCGETSGKKSKEKTSKESRKSGEARYRQGARGLPGPDGPKGRTGLPGLSGPNGQMGQRGLAGLNGLDGLQGFPGDAGVMGDSWDGPKGDKGPEGTSVPGLPGLPGLDGLEGLKGEKGEAVCDCPESDSIVLAFSTSTVLNRPSDEVRVVTFDTPVTSVFTHGPNPFDKDTGKFTAPVGGTYSISLTGIARGNVVVPLEIYKNSDKLGSLGMKASPPNPVSTLRTVIDLVAGDELLLKVPSKKDGFLGSIINELNSDTDLSYSLYLI